MKEIPYHLYYKGRIKIKKCGSIVTIDRLGDKRYPIWTEDKEYCGKRQTLANGFKKGEVLLVCRRLSDITDDELKEMFAIVFMRPFPNSGKIYRYPKKDKELDRKLLWSGLDRFAFDVSGDHWADCDLSAKRYNQHAITLYLLSKGFWLFGDQAFDEGLIIDAKTVTSIK